jgi:hypothetical protein
VPIKGSRTELSSRTGQPQLAQTDRLAAMTTALIRLCERVSDRGLMFGLVYFVIGLWVGRFTVHKALLWGLLGS